ncbi:MAG TPA: cobalamin-independent methionine synthase II family protein [Pseudolabrys sp.]|nr:cobalamin-independent methionine synthase II family protein [Pseudolabrys sp.]
MTTHTGSLPRPADLVDLLNKKELGESYDQASFAARTRRAVSDVVRQQAETGIDIVDDGEHTKVNWMAYARARLSGLQEIDSPVRFRGPTRDSLAFPRAYEDMKVMLAARSSALVAKRQLRPQAQVCVGPIAYIGQNELKADIANLKAALKGVSAEEAFMTAISPSNLELYYENRYYGSDEEYLFALAEAMHVEYKAIVDAGFVLQIDDPRMATHYNRAVDASLEQCRKFIALRVEAVNHALRGIPEDRVRFHTCYSVNIAPRVHDFELKYFVDLMLQVRAGAYLIEAANPRHEHEWQVWQNVKLPYDKVLVPGVVSHCIHLVEHPELVAQRIVRFADVVGRERVIAGTDCGFGTSGAGDEVHPEVAWAKLRSMVDGARLASQRLWGS